MRLPAFMQPRILKQAVQAVFSPAFTTRFPAEPFEPQDAFRGRPRFDVDGCAPLLNQGHGTAADQRDVAAEAANRSSFISHYDLLPIVYS